MTRTRRVSRTAASWSIAGIIGIAALGLWFTMVSRGPLVIDRVVNDAVSVTRGTAAHAIAVALAEIGSGVGATACFVIATAALLVRRRRRDALSVAFAGGLGVLISELTKRFVARPRPADPLVTSAGFSFPSGHSMGAATLACSLLFVVLGWQGLSRTVVRCTALAAVSWVLIMMWSRIALHVHWISDTIAGAVLGLCVAVLSRRLWVGDHSPTRSV